jgi:hypothetical protein
LLPLRVLETLLGLGLVALEGEIGLVHGAHLPEELGEVEVLIDCVFADVAARDEALTEAAHALGVELPEGLVGRDVFMPDAGEVYQRLGWDLVIAAPIEIPEEALGQFPAAAAFSWSW